MRRTRFTLWLLHHSSGHFKVAKLNRGLRKAGKDLGRLRDLDVAVKRADDYKLNSVAMRRRRKICYRSATKTMDFIKRKEIAKRLHRMMAAIRDEHGLTFEPGISKMHAELAAWRRMEIHRKSDFHRFRIVIKKANCVLSALERPIQSLKSLQDILGQIHDLEILQDFLGKQATLKSDRKVLQEQALRLVKPVLAQALNRLH